MRKGYQLQLSGTTEYVLELKEIPEATQIREVYCISVSITGLSCPKCKQKISLKLKENPLILDVAYAMENADIFMSEPVDFLWIKEVIEAMGTYWVEELV